MYETSRYKEMLELINAQKGQNGYQDIKAYPFFVICKINFSGQLPD